MFVDNSSLKEGLISKNGDSPNDEKQDGIVVDKGVKDPVYKKKLETAGKILYLISLIYLFLLGLGLMGESFKLLGGRSAGNAFKSVDNPIAGLMVGILATALVQSSSTSTSIVVSMVGSGIIDVKDAIPIIFGANMGTSVTNTLVSMTHITNLGEFELAFAGATIHDFFNLLSILVLLPLELISGFLEWITGEFTKLLTGGEGSKWEGPIEKLVQPLTDLLLKVDKKKIEAIAQGDNVEGTLIKKGAFKDSGMSDNAVGGVCLAISLTMLCVALILLVKYLKTVLETKVGEWLKKSLNVNAFVSMLIGAVLTILVQSSSVVTSAMVPLVATGTIDLERLLPLTMGTNLGTTVTALLASLTQTSSSALQIALVHLFFNICGSLIWYPIPLMRKVPLSLARNLGKEVKKKRWVAIAYTLVVFLIVPLALLGFSEGPPWLLWFGILFLVALISGFFGILWVVRNRPDLIPCEVLRPTEEEVIFKELIETSAE